MILRLILLLAATLALAGDARWRIIGPGGGGSMYHPTVSPHDPRTVVVACDMTGSYITHDGGETWRIFNLGGPVGFFVWDPLDPNVLYARASGLMRSGDGGVTWKRILPRPETIEKTTVGDDHGEEYLHVKGEMQGDVTAMTVDPGDSRWLFAATGSVLWSSVDTGATWQKSADLPRSAIGIWINPKSPKGGRTIYAAGPNAMYVRREGKWSTGQSPGQFTSVAGAPPVFYATSGGRMWVSEGGMTWQEAGTAAGKQATAIATSVSDPHVAYLSYEGRNAGVAKTSDRGRNWEALAYNGRDAWLSDRFGAGWAGNPLGIGVAPGDARVAYATDSGRVMRTTDGGKTWLPAYSRRTPDGNWTTNGIDVTTDYGVHFDPFDTRHMFIGYTDIGLWASDNGGDSWYSATRAGVPNTWVNTTYWMEFDPAVRGRMWAAMSGTHDLPRPKMWRHTMPGAYVGGVVRSDDGGHTWRVQNNGMPPTAATHILRDPAGTLYVTGFGRGVFKSTDGGEHWALKNAGIEGAQPFAWRMARDAKGALYLVVARKSDDGGYGNEDDGAVYRSTDGAEHWTRLRLPEGVNGPNGIAVDPGDPRAPHDASRLYLAAWGRSTKDGAAGGGVYLSTNGGATWRVVLGQDQHVYDVTIDPRDARVIYACGFESAAWRSGDRGATWKKMAGYDFKWGHRVIPDPRDAAKIYITTFGGSVWVGPSR